MRRITVNLSDIQPTEPVLERAVVESYMASYK